MIHTNAVLDAKGLACPMPIVKAKKAMDGLEAGEVLEVQATDKGSTADLKAWAEGIGHQYLGTIDEAGILKHYLRKASGEEKQEKKHPNTMTNEELLQKMESHSAFLLLDVRESAEFAFRHIPNALSLPLGDLEKRLNELNNEEEIFVICRTGNRSDLAAQKLAGAGFRKVTNVIPGMSEWSGPVEKMVNQ
ncbi:sulfurtransferase TusA family protein [Metabacillus sp. RGM 3146]|uniref:sulfurtransferase TusA family protein n=1 Tax=Metabacillus sp. RGM 3146 TaxID=3401092 RepID=UPI003B9BDFDB